MNKNNHRFQEYLPDKLNIQHKIAPTTEKKEYHLHNHMEMILPVSDNLIYRSDQIEFPIPAGSILLINSMILHKIDYVRESGLCDRYVLYFDPELALRLNPPEFNLLDCFVRHQEDGLLLDLPAPERASLENHFFHMNEVMKEIQSLNSDSQHLELALNRLELNFSLCECLILVNRLFYSRYGLPTTASYQAQSRTVSEICHYIEEHFYEDLSIENLAATFYIGKTKLYNLFHEVLGISVSEYVSNIRIAQAKSLLIHTDYSMEIISQMTRYANSSSFSRLFKSKVGMTPLQYRKYRKAAL